MLTREQIAEAGARMISSVGGISTQVGRLRAALARGQVAPEVTAAELTQLDSALDAFGRTVASAALELPSEFWTRYLVAFDPPYRTSDEIAFHDHTHGDPSVPHGRSGSPTGSRCGEAAHASRPSPAFTPYGRRSRA